MKISRIHKLAVWAGSLGLVCFLVFVSFYFFPHLPTVPDPVSGYIHPLNDHGTIKYLNDTQLRVRLTFGFLALSFGAMFIALAIKLKGLANGSSR